MRVSSDNAIMRFALCAPLGVCKHRAKMMGAFCRFAVHYEDDNYCIAEIAKGVYRIGLMNVCPLHPGFLPIRPKEGADG